MLTHEDGLKATGLLYRWLDLVYKEDGPALRDKEGWDLVAETKQYVKWAAGGRDYEYKPIAAPNPREQAATTAKALTSEEEYERNVATCEIYDERERNYALLDDGRNPDGTGESFAERNL